MFCFVLIQTARSGLLSCKQLRKSSLSSCLTASCHSFLNLDRALLPDLVKFSYIPKNDLKVNENDISSGKRRDKSPDFTIPSSSGSLASEDEHILVLDLSDNLKGKRSRNAGWVCCDRIELLNHHKQPRLSYQQPPSLSPAALKKLIETRNNVFKQAVNEYVIYSPSLTRT